MLDIENITFDKQFNGYDRGQVDRYFSKMAEAYRAAYEEYNTACGRYYDLLEDYKKLEEKEQSKPDAGVIAKTLVDTETLAQKIIADANSEASVITADARAGARMITADASAEAEAAQEQSKKVVEDAYLEAARITSQARRDREQTDEIVENAIARLQEMLSLSFNSSDMRYIDDAPVLVPLRPIGVGS